MPTDPNPTEVHPPMDGEPPDWVPEWICISCGEPLDPGKDVCDECVAASFEAFTKQQGEETEPPAWMGEVETGDA
jgi:hypothetical protein